MLPKSPSADSLAHFRWAVHPAGYHISLLVPAAGKLRRLYGGQAVRFLSAISPATAPLRIYDPLVDTPALFKTFANTPQDPQGIMAFANQYGFLGVPELARPIQSEPQQLPAEMADTLGMGPRVRRAPAVKAESVDRWLAEIQQMADLIATWEAIQREDQSFLAKRIWWRKQEAVGYRNSMGASLVIADQTTQHRVGLLSRIDRGDRIFPAKLALQLSVNEQLENKGVSPQLLWNREWTALEVSVVPSTLLACMWLQFARAITGQWSYRACAKCQKWFQSGGGTVGCRSDKIYCCGTCKAAAHAKKKVAARRLYRSGLKDKEIADRLNTRLVTVRRWVADRAS